MRRIAEPRVQTALAAFVNVLIAAVGTVVLTVGGDEWAATFAAVSTGANAILGAFAALLRAWYGSDVRQIEAAGLVPVDPARDSAVLMSGSGVYTEPTLWVEEKETTRA